MTDWTYKPYCGVGSPRTPEHILWVMRHLATRLALTGWTLRSGGGQGPDAAFEAGCVDAAPGMPYDQGKRRVPPREVYGVADAEALRATPADRGTYAQYVGLYKAARAAHPAWSRCDDQAQLRLISGLFRLLGPYPLEAPVPVHFAVYWHDGQGDTGQTVRYAERWNRGEYGVWGADGGDGGQDAQPGTAQTKGWQIDLRNLHDPEVLERALAKIEIAPGDYRAQWKLRDDYLPVGHDQGTWPRPDAVQPTVFLLGHGGDPQPAFVKRLTANRITEVVDVRPDADDPADVPWATPPELAEHLGLHKIAYGHPFGDLASADLTARTAGVRDLAAHLWAHPDERVALLDRAGQPDRQSQLALLLPLLRAQGVGILRLWRDGHVSPA